MQKIRKRADAGTTEAGTAEAGTAEADLTAYPPWVLTRHSTQTLQYRWNCRGTVNRTTPPLMGGVNPGATWRMTMWTRKGSDVNLSDGVDYDQDGEDDDDSYENEESDSAAQPQPARAKQGQDRGGRVAKNLHPCSDSSARAMRRSTTARTVREVLLSSLRIFRQQEKGI